MNKKTEKRIREQLAIYRKRFNEALKAKMEEADTQRRIVGVFVDALGYDRYDEIFDQYDIVGSKCDLAVFVGDGGKRRKPPDIIVECKRIGVRLQVDHLNQVPRYASLEGVRCAVLTNGAEWRVYTIDPRKHDRKMARQ